MPLLAGTVPGFAVPIVLEPKYGSRFGALEWRDAKAILSRRRYGARPGRPDLPLAGQPARHIGCRKVIPIYNNTGMHACAGAFGSRFEFLEFKPHTCHTAAVLVQPGPEQSPVLKPLAGGFCPLDLSGTT